VPGNWWLVKHTISVLVENEFGVLARVAGLFSGRGYNIESLSVAPTLDGRVSRMTIVTSAGNEVMEQVIKQLNKLLNVIKVQNVTATTAINRTLAMIKVNLGKKNQQKLQKIVRQHGGVVIDADERCSIVQAVADDAEVKKLVGALAPYGIMEYVATGNLAIQKGKRVMEA
jgi:acetolactate synthase-1/3 small subunit